MKRLFAHLLCAGRTSALRTLAAWLLALCGGFSSLAQNDSTLRDLVETRNYTRGNPTSIQFTPDGQQVLFLRSGPRDDRRSLFEFSVADGSTRQVIDAAKILGGSTEVLSAAERARRERMRLTASGLANYLLSKDGQSILLPLAGKLFALTRTNGLVREIHGTEGAIDPQWAPDNKQVGFVVGQDVYIVDALTQQRRAITTGGTEAVAYGLAEFVAQEEMARMHGFWWAPDSQSLLVEKADARGVETWRVNDPMNPDRNGEPQFYPRPGHSNVVTELGVYSVTGGAPVWIQWDRTKYPYVGSVDWDAKGGLTIQVLSRNQKELALLLANPASGNTKQLIEVHDDAWVTFVPGLVQWLDDGSGFLWATEHEPAFQLELRGPEGQLLKVLASDAIGAHLNERSIPSLESHSGNIVFQANPDPTLLEFWRVNARSGQPEKLAGAPRSSSGIGGPKGLYAVAASDAQTPAQWSIYRADGTVAGTLPSLAAKPGTLPVAEFTKVGPGLGFYAKVVRPRDFDRTKHYPVIAAVYGGPLSQTVGQGYYSAFHDQWLANQGFIVVSADGRGTPGRGRSWERAITNHLADVPLAETVAALQALGARYPELDLNRVGITGWSFGGYLSALAALRRPDVFKAAAAGAPVTDWMDYDTCYTERYLGVPGPGDEVYRRNSLIEDARSLRCPLLLIHGTTDDNVFFRHSLKLADALFKAGRPFEFLPLSGFTHMVPDPLVKERLEERLVTFFHTHLGQPK